MIIDTHAHIYSSDEQNYPPISDPYKPPSGTGDTNHLRDEMTKAGVDRAVLIQTTDIYAIPQHGRQTGLLESVLLTPIILRAPIFFMRFMIVPMLKVCGVSNLLMGVMMAPVFAAYGRKLLNLG